MKLLMGGPEEKEFLGFENREMAIDRRLVAAGGVLWRGLFRRAEKKVVDAMERSGGTRRERNVRVERSRRWISGFELLGLGLVGLGLGRWRCKFLTEIWVSIRFNFSFSPLLALEYVLDSLYLFGMSIIIN